MPNIIDVTAASRKNVPQWGNGKQYIAVHYLGVVGQNNKIDSGGYGAHYYIYWDGTIYKAADHDAILWQVGTAGYYTQKHPQARNSNTIGIEMCPKCDGDSSRAEDPKWYFTEATQKACVELVKYLMQQLGVGTDHVLRHYDIVNKWCPAPYCNNNRYRDTWTWDEFKAKLTGSSSGSSGGSSGGSGAYGTGMYKVNVDDLAIRTGPSTKYTQCGSITDHGTYTITEVQNTCWGKLKSGAGWICIDADYCTPARSTGGGNTSTEPTNPTKPTTGGTAYMFNCPQISYGSQGNAVLLAQEILKARGYYTGELDKMFGALMKSATIAYQTDRNGGAGPVDGIIGPKCWADMIAL